MLHEQKLQSLHCRDLRVDNTKFKWPTVLSTLPMTKWLFKYSVSKPPKVSSILSLLVPFVEKFWNYSVKVNLVSLLDITFNLFLTQTAVIFRVASGKIALKYYLFAISTDFIQTWQKRRQLFGHKFVSNRWPIWNFKCARSRCKTCPFFSIT